MKKLVCLLAAVILAVCGLCACAPDSAFEKAGITVTLLNGDHYRVIGDNKVEAPDGKAVFKVTLDDGYSVSGATGDKCDFTAVSPTECEVRFNGAHYSCVAQLETQKIYTQFYSLYYFLGEGDPVFQDCTELIAHHYKANTLTERDLLDRGVISEDEERMLAGWQTEDGQFLGLGNRAEVSADGAVYLFAVWKDYSDVGDFTVENGKITSYSGSGEEVVIPRKIGGEEITSIGSNAFENCSAKSFYVPSTVTAIEPEAFKACASMTDFYLTDNITVISDSSFTECKNFENLHINAVLAPVYVAYNDGKKSDVLNGLSVCKGKKLVIMGGSSVMYGYSGGLMEEIVGDYSVFDLGLMAKISQTIWLDLIEDYLGEGDIYLHAPELNGGAVSAFIKDSCLTNSPVTQFCSQLYYVFESDWGLVQNLKINNYCEFFDTFGGFNDGKKQAIASGQAARYTDYNTYLDDYGSVRSENDDCNRKDYVFGLNGPFRFDEVTDEFLDNAVRLLYEPLSQKGVKLFFTFSTLNLRNLFELYADEDGAYAAAADYTQRVRSHIGEHITILLTQRDSIYDSEYFCDTDYHLGHTKRIEHTRAVAEALKACL